MPAIADQVATIEHDLEDALARVDTLTAEKDALSEKLSAISRDKQDLEAKQDDMQSLVDETRELANHLANAALKLLHASRRQVGAPQVNAGNSNARVGENGSAELLTKLLAAVSAAVEPVKPDACPNSSPSAAAPVADRQPEQTTAPPASTAAALPPPHLTGENVGLKPVPSPRMAANQVRPHLASDTAAGALRVGSEQVRLPDGLPMFLQSSDPEEGIVGTGDPRAGTASGPSDSSSQLYPEMPEFLRRIPA